MRVLAAALICAISILLSPLRGEAQGWVDQPFDPAPMSREDIATVQVALAYTGDFFGYADGVWKEDSQKALVQYVERTQKTTRPLYRHLEDLVMFMEDERVKNNWQLFYSDTSNTSYLHPFGLLKEVPESEVKDAVEFLSDDGGFSLMVRFHDQADMQGVHDYFYNEATKGSKPYRYSDNSVWVTDAKLDDGLHVYARSDYYNNSWSTISAVVTEDYYYRMNVVAVSITAGGSPATLMWTDGGVIDTVINGGASASAPPADDPSDPKDQVRRPGVAMAPKPEPLPEPEPGPDDGTVVIADNDAPLGTPKPNPDPTPDPTPDPGPAPEPEKDDVIGITDPGSKPKRDTDKEPPLLNEPPVLGGPGTLPPVDTPDTPETPRDKVTGTLKGSGTGFYITPTKLVTAAHVVDGCGAVAMIDGTPLDIVKSDSSLDLAILSGAVDNGVWLKLSALEVPKLGEAVTALGYPYYTSLDQGLTVTSGNVSALRGIDGSSNRVMITAPVQPGNSGGPLLNKKGAVIGVVVSRVDDMAILEETGSLPQNMNFAVPSGPLLTFLAQSRVTRPQGDGTGGDMSGEVPEGLANAVVPLYCYE